MDHEDYVIRAICWGILTVVVLWFGSCQANNLHVTNAIEKGVDPVTAFCIFNVESNTAICAAHEARK